MFDNHNIWNKATLIDCSDDSLTRNWILILHHVFQPINNPNKNICKQTETLSTLFVSCLANSLSHIYLLPYTVQLPKRATQKLHLRNMKLFLIDDRNSSCLTSINYRVDLIMKYLWQYMGSERGSIGYLSAISVPRVCRIGELLLNEKLVMTMLWTENIQINH